MVVVAVHRGGVVFSSFTARVVVITKCVAGMDRHSERKLIEKQQDERLEQEGEVRHNNILGHCSHVRTAKQLIKTAKAAEYGGDRQ